jgi:O-antigen/teichoic acid export membrane protein
MTLDAMLPGDFAERPAGGSVAARGQVRGSTLLLAGRGVSKAANFLLQVLVVRYLSQTDYGTLAYALGLVGLAQSVIGFGLDRAITRFIPLYEERREYDKLRGTLVLVFTVVWGLGLAMLLVVYGAMAAGSQTLLDHTDPPRLIWVLAVLGPIQACDDLLVGLLAVLGRSRAIFVRRHLAGPALRLVVLAGFVLARCDVRQLAVGYVVAAVAGAGISAGLLYGAVCEQGLWAKLQRTATRIPWREVLGFTVPLLSSDLLYLVVNTVDIVLLEHFCGARAVAEFRAVQPAALLNQFVLAGFATLFTPAAARLWARNDRPGIHSLYWQTAAWIAVLSFPIFALTFSLSAVVTALLFGEAYRRSGPILAILAAGYYFSAAVGHNGLVLKVCGQVRYIVGLNLAAVLINLGINLCLIPRWGALGAAVGTSATIIVHNVLKQFGLTFASGVQPFDRRYVGLYSAIGMAALVLIMARCIAPPWPALGMAGVLATVWVCVAGRGALDIARTFPELSRLTRAGSSFWKVAGKCRAIENNP